MINAYTVPLPLFASFAVFHENLGIITYNFVCIVELHLLEKKQNENDKIPGHAVTLNYGQHYQLTHCVKVPRT